MDVELHPDDEADPAEAELEGRLEVHEDVVREHAYVGEAEDGAHGQERDAGGDQHRDAEAALERAYTRLRREDGER